MEISIDCDVRAVLEFMERNVIADKLLRVAAAVSSLAPVLWSDLTPLQRCPVLSLTERNHAQQSVATQSRLEQHCERDGSVAEADSH